MPKFRKKPVEIEAVHLNNDTTPGKVAYWCGGRVVPHPEKNYTGGPMVIEIDTLEGTMRAEPGDWIIKGVAGEFYPCRDDIFRATYEPVASAPAATEATEPTPSPLRTQITAAIRDTPARYPDDVANAVYAVVLRHTAAWTPPPPGDRREQLPNHLLALIDIPPYLSTACQTADLLALQATHNHPLHDEIRQHAERLHQRCRLNNKFTGQLCACGCHPEPVPPA